MASYSGVSDKHAQLAASTVDTVTLDRDYPEVEVVNRDGAAEIYFTVDGSNPTVAGDNTEYLPATSGASVRVSAGAFVTGTPTVVKLISSGTPKYSVQGV